MTCHHSYVILWLSFFPCSVKKTKMVYTVQAPAELNIFINLWVWRLICPLKLKKNAVLKSCIFLYNLSFYILQGSKKFKKLK